MVTSGIIDTTPRRDCSRGHKERSRSLVELFMGWFSESGARPGQTGDNRGATADTNSGPLRLPAVGESVRACSHHATNRWSAGPLPLELQVIANEPSTVRDRPEWQNG